MAGSAVVGALRVTLGLDSAAFTKGLTAAQKQLRDVGRQFQSVGKTMATVGAGMSAAITAPLIAAGFAASKAAQESADAMGQVEAALKSMGDASGKTKEELAGLATGLMRNSLYDDDEILRKVTSNLLTFGKISGDQFKRAQQAAVDLATRMKMDLQPATILVGKALNDPIKGLTAMGRAGIQFTDAQKAMIKAMVATGNAAGAQRIILGELEHQFGGAAAAAQNTDPWDKLRDSLNDLSETVGGIINQYLAPLADRLAAMLDRFKALSPEAQKFVVVAAAIAAALGPVLIVVGAVVSAIGVLLPVLGVIGAPLLAIAAAAAAVGVAFYLFRDEIVPIVQSFAAAVQESVGPKIMPLWTALKEAVAEIGSLFTAIFGEGAGESATAAVKLFGVMVARTFGAAIDIITGAVKVVTNVLRALQALLRGDFSAMWGYLGAAVMSAVGGIAKAFETLFPEVVSWVKKTYEGVKEWMVGKFVDLVNKVVQKVDLIKRAFFDLYDAVVGHSYVPDMIDGIRDEFARLDQVMVKPALDAARKVDAAFAGIRGSNDNLQNPAGRLGQAKGGNNGREVLVPADIAQSADLGSGPDAVAWGGKVFSANSLNDLRDQFVKFGMDFAGAIKSGDLGSFFQNIAMDFAARLLQSGLGNLFDAIGGGGSGGGIISSIFSGLPGFKTGGSFKVGGSGGMDSQTVAFRASPGEMVNITHGNDNGPAGVVQHFDLRGAVVTEKLYQDMRATAAQAAGAVYGQIKGEQAAANKAARYKVAR